MDRGLLDRYEKVKYVLDLIDEDTLDEAMEIVVQVLRNPVVLPQKAVVMINQLKAANVLLSTYKTYYTVSAPKSQEQKEIKAHLYTLSEQLDGMVDVLKYSARQ